MRTVPVNHSAGPLPEGWEPPRWTSMRRVLSFCRLLVSTLHLKHGRAKNRAVAKSVAPRKMHTGSVSTQAMRMLMSVSLCRPERLAAIVPAMPEESTWVVLTGSPMQVCQADGRRGHQFGRGALGVGQVRLADLFADRNDDPLPADHRAQAQREGDGHLDPRGNVLDDLAQVVDCGLGLIRGRGIWRACLPLTSLSTHSATR